jgi:hypothetical protein
MCRVLPQDAGIVLHPGRCYHGFRRLPRVRRGRPDLDSDALHIVYLIVAARLLLPLLIPRYPLWGLLACMVLDSADQSIMQAFGIDFPRYQGYDKAFDIYYLSIAYLATMRNWENLTAFQVSRALFYLRLAGVLAFELTGVRMLLAIFSNAFEPFFVYYELVRRRGNPMLLTRNAMLAVVGVIWFVFKLPHEWWVHIAQLDATDFIKTKVLGASPATSFWRAIFEAPFVTGTLLVIAALTVLAARRLVDKRKQRATQAESTGELPTAGVLRNWMSHWRRPKALAVVGAALALQQARQRLKVAVLRGHTASRIRPWVLVEKTVLVSMVAVVFQQLLPGLETNGFQTALFVAVTMVCTDFLLRWVFRRYGVPVWARVDLLVTALLNFFVVLLFQLFIPVLAPSYDLESALIFAALTTLFVTLYDHYRPVYDVRAVEAASEERLVLQN